MTATTARPPAGLVVLRDLVSAADRLLARGALANAGAALEETRSLRLLHRYEESELLLVGPPPRTPLSA